MQIPVVSCLQNSIVTEKTNGLENEVATRDKKGTTNFLITFVILTNRITNGIHHLPYLSSLNSDHGTGNRLYSNKNLMKDL